MADEKKKEDHPVGESVGAAGGAMAGMTAGAAPADRPARLSARRWARSPVAWPDTVWPRRSMAVEDESGA